MEERGLDVRVAGRGVRQGWEGIIWKEWRYGGREPKGCSELCSED